MDEVVPNESRRNFIRTAAGITTGLVAGRLPEIMQSMERNEDEDFTQAVRGLTYDHLHDPEQKEVQVFMEVCAKRYIKDSGLEELEVKDLVERTFLRTTKQEFVDGIVEAGETLGEKDFSNTYGRVTYKSRVANINLDLISEDAFDETIYPGVLLYRVLVHEWGDLNTIDRTSGDYLNNGRESLAKSSEPDYPPEPWNKYRGGKVMTENLTALYSFGNAWNELTTRMIVMKGIKSDEDLVQVEVALASNSVYRAITDKLLRLVQQVGIGVEDLARMHKESDVEGMLKKLGSIFSDEALDLVDGSYRGNRTDEQALAEKDFLVGKRVAFALSNEEWEKYYSLLKNINYIPQRS